jgi:hypothetical protein
MSQRLRMAALLLATAAGRRALGFGLGITGPLARQAQVQVARPMHYSSSSWSSKSAKVRLGMSAVQSETGEEIAMVDLPTNESSDKLLRIRHTSAHVMAMAVQRLFPKTQVTIGPWIENGFYYDFYSPDKQFTDDDLKSIKKEMDRIIKSKMPLVREEVSRCVAGESGRVKLRS